MSKQVLALTLGVLAVLSIGLMLFMQSNKKVHLVLDAKMQKVRVQEVDPNRTIVVLDFRVNNPAEVLYRVKNVEVLLTTAEGEQLKGTIAAEMDTEQIFAAYPSLGQKFNQSFISREALEGGKTIDRMIAASFDASLKAIEGRKKLILRIQEIDGLITEVTE